ncbi:hypothetical protein [Actinomyces sp. 565]|uniref:hypothetical protein n=1 Tax=Actinomyces sp. 565 TaxID=2057794 RepID=UPI0013A70A06|nr:hypothetical protein [Actinomyces sp. 565]NDR53027.1 hypothetical protein [Actinomyces sp. 565]
MTRSTRFPRLVPLAATGLTAVALSLSLAACSSSDSGSADPASTESSQSVTVESSADAAQAPDGAAVPEGFTLVEVPEYGISVAVPSDWETLTSANASDTELVARVAKARDMSEDEVIADLEDRPLLSIDTAADGDFAPYLVLSRIDDDGPLPSEDKMQSLAELNAAETSELEQTTSGSGADASLFTMSASDDGVQYNFSAVSVSEGDDAYITTVVVSDSAQQAQEVSEAVLASL